MSQQNNARAGFMPARVVHLHPSLFCNLACQHCYSASSPDKRHHLDPQQIIDALAILWDEGYDLLSLSGGEPLLYPYFETVLTQARQIGFRVTAISNGSPVGGKTLDLITQHLASIAISLDGAPETHNTLRGNAKAFAHAERAFKRLAQKEVSFGISYCISQQSLSEIPWVLDYAEAVGAQTLQMHPFATIGRGRVMAPSLSLDDTDMTRAYVIANVLADYDNPVVRADIASIEQAQAQRDDYAALFSADKSNVLLSDMISPIIIDEHGRLIPYCYGVHSRFAIGTLGDGLQQAIIDFKAQDGRHVPMLIDNAFTNLDDCTGDFVDWFFHIVQTSHQMQPAL